jgi:hypothetical protein
MSAALVQLFATYGYAARFGPERALPEAGHGTGHAALLLALAVAIAVAGAITAYLPARRDPFTACVAALKMVQWYAAPHTVQAATGRGAPEGAA